MACSVPGAASWRTLSNGHGRESQVSPVHPVVFVEDPTQVSLKKSIATNNYLSTTLLADLQKPDYYYFVFSLWLLVASLLGATDAVSPVSRKLVLIFLTSEG